MVQWRVGCLSSLLLEALGQMTKPKDITGEGLDTCENPPPEGFEHLEPCCRARLHKDRCLFWKQEQDGANHGIHTYEIDGSDKHGLVGRAVQMFDMKGASSDPKEVAALVQYLEWVHGECRPQQEQRFTDGERERQERGNKGKRGQSG